MCEYRYEVFIFVARCIGTYLSAKFELVKKHNEDKVKDALEEKSVCKVIADANIEEGVDVKIGDKIKICAIDGEAVMIEILSNKNNPYFIDINFLKSITDYK